MITISENATLNTPAVLKWFFVMIASSKKCQDIIFLRIFLIVICSINMISVNVAVLQIENIIYA